MLAFRSVDVAIAGIQILRGVSFEITAGETVALIGRNGAGKTTTMRTVMGFTQTSGSIWFDGKSLDNVPAHGRAGLGIGYAPEDRRLFSAFTVEENVLMPIQVARLPAAEIDRRRDRVYDIVPELREMADRPAGSVSGGQGKMIALGRALTIGAKLIMLDEPFQGLAPALAQRYAETLRNLREADREVALLISESNPALLSALAGRTMVIERGEIHDAGS